MSLLSEEVCIVLRSGNALSVGSESSYSQRHSKPRDPQRSYTDLVDASQRMCCSCSCSQHGTTISSIQDTNVDDFFYQFENISTKSMDDKRELEGVLRI